MIAKKLILIDLDDQIEFSLYSESIYIKSGKANEKSHISIQLEKCEVEEVIKFLQCRLQEL